MSDVDTMYAWDMKTFDFDQQAGFVCYQFVDGGQAVVMKSGRVLPNLRGMGTSYVYKVHKYWSQYMNDMEPRPQWTYSTTVDAEVVLKKVQNNPKTHHIAVTRVDIS